MNGWIEVLTSTEGFDDERNQGYCSFMTRLLTTFLFAEPRFSFGFARLLDLAGTFNVYNNSKSEAEADLKALLSDWYVVSADVLDAMEKADSEGCWSHAEEKRAPAGEPIHTA